MPNCKRAGHDMQGSRAELRGVARITAPGALQWTAAAPPDRGHRNDFPATCVGANLGCGDPLAHRLARCQNDWGDNKEGAHVWACAQKMLAAAPGLAPRTQWRAGTLSGCVKACWLLHGIGQQLYCAWCVAGAATPATYGLRCAWRRCTGAGVWGSLTSADCLTDGRRGKGGELLPLHNISTCHGAAAKGLAPAHGAASGPRAKGCGRIAWRGAGDRGPPGEQE